MTAAQVIKDMVRIIMPQAGHNERDAFDRLLEMIAFDNCPHVVKQMPDRLSWLLGDEEFYNKLLTVYAKGRQVLVEDAYDALGDHYIEGQSKWSASAKGQFLTPCDVTRMMTRINIGTPPEGDKPITVCDPCAGTGRMLMSAHEILGPRGYYFGVDIDRTALQIAFVNAGLKGMRRTRLLHANSLMYDINPSSPNWDYSNQLFGPVASWDRLLKLGEGNPEPATPEIKPESPTETEDEPIILFGEQMSLLG